MEKINEIIESMERMLNNPDPLACVILDKENMRVIIEAVKKTKPKYDKARVCRNCNQYDIVEKYCIKIKAIRGPNSFCSSFSNLE